MNVQKEICHYLIFIILCSLFEPLGECRRYIHIYPAGSACGTVSDLALFAKTFLCDSKDCPLFDKDETLDEMQ